MTAFESDEMVSNYQRYIFRKIMFIVICVIGVVLTIGYASTIGSANLSIQAVYETIYNHFFNQSAIIPENDWVVFTIRLPRILTGMVAGLTLGIAGAAMQSMMKNPLADPYTTGISSGASFGATLAIGLNVTLFGVSGTTGTIVTAFVFALIPAAVIILVSSIRQTSAATMILAGIAVMYLFNSLTTIIKLALPDGSLTAVFQWTVGDLSRSSWESFQVIAIFGIAGGIILMAVSKKLNILITGDKNARALGLDAHKLRILLLIVISLMSAAVVCFTGIIGFVGLVAPHIVRIFLGSDNRYLIPASAAFGAVLLMVSDVISRTIIAPTFLPVGVITSFIGCPMFLWLLLKARKSMW